MPLLPTPPGDPQSLSPTPHSCDHASATDESTKGVSQVSGGPALGPALDLRPPRSLTVRAAAPFTPPWKSVGNQARKGEGGGEKTLDSLPICDWNFWWAQLTYWLTDCAHRTAPHRTAHHRSILAGQYAKISARHLTLSASLGVSGSEPSRLQDGRLTAAEENGKKLYQFLDQIWNAYTVLILQ